ncbi:MAG: trypsin-like peptidase domain-containing protein [Gammaproteobacteria bacterium]|nr:trypsin-like peptidase domain-containing protein [Gammaproteobacteria bacterium]MCF6230691.1 trypsin-like peptidase domain-containing protein [Gammaproteobacteria bacterium]
MHQEGFLSFIYRYVVLGLAVAFLTLLILFYLYPEIFRGEHKIAVIEATPHTTAPASYADAVQAAAPAIVNIYTTKVITEKNPYFDDQLLKRFFGNLLVPRHRLERSLGSGVIISQEGYLLSNYHVVENADEILVALQDGRTTEAQLVGGDPDTDLAVLKITLDQLPAITLGHSEKLRVGDIAMAIGNPFGVGQTVTLGIISATGRSDLGITTFENFIQTDAAINPGNSGGGLINAYGELIGINTAIFSQSGGSQGIGFAIPIHVARATMEQIIAQGYIPRGWLGFDTQNLTPQLLETFNQANLSGVLINRVYRNSPAHAAGVRPGDVLIELNGKPVRESRQLYREVIQLPPNSEVMLKVLRGKNIYPLSSTVIQRPEEFNP